MVFNRSIDWLRFASALQLRTHNQKSCTPSRDLGPLVTNTSLPSNYKHSNMADESASEATTYVKLVSAEGFEFFLDKQIAVAHSKTIKLMLEGSFREANENCVTFPEMAGYILERVVKYLMYKAQYSNATTRIPEFSIEPEVALELLLAAKYLDC